MQRSIHNVSSFSSSLPTMDSIMEQKQSSHQPSSVAPQQQVPDQLFSSSLYHESPFGGLHETTLSSLSEPVVFRGIHAAYQLGDNSNGNSDIGNGYGNGGAGTFNGDTLFDQSSLWPTSQSYGTYGSADKLELPSMSMAAVPMKSQSSSHRAHEPSLDDSLDGLISSSLWEQPTPAAAPTGAPFGAAKELFVTVTPTLASHVTLTPHDHCPPLPVYVERYNSFTVSRRAVLEDIIAHLVAIGVDHSVHDHKIRGLVYPSGQRTGSCEFHINRYRCDTPMQWMIEVQRRAGCMFAFSQLYRSIVAATSSYHVNTNEPLLSAVPSSSSPNVPSSSSPSSSSNSNSNSDMLPTVEPLTVKQLTTMASSSAVEVARAGMESLAILTSVSVSCAATCTMAIRTATLPLLSLASTMVATASPATARAAADLVANICAASHDGVALALSSSPLVTSLFNMLDAPSSLSLRDTKRHCARAIAAMATTDITGLRQSVASYNALPTSAFTAMAILERYTHTDDLPLRTSIDHALLALRSA